MSFRNTWILLAVAASLFAFIFFYQRHAHTDVASDAHSFPRIDPAQVDSIQVRPGRELEIRAVRTNGGWRLVEPLEWPAEALSLEKFLTTLSELQPAAYITPSEVRARPDAERQYGFDAPRASIILRQGSGRVHMLLGASTAPGDQFFLQVVGIEGVYVINAETLKIVPTHMNEWRDGTLVDLNRMPVDLVSVTNGPKLFSLRRDADRSWKMVYPIRARADQARIHEALEKVHSLRVREFVTDDPGADMESFGLQPPRLQIALQQGTNPAAHLFFGKSPTNKIDEVYARKADWRSVVTVSKQFVEAFEDPANSFRDPFLLSTADPVQSIVTTGRDAFNLEWQASGGWRIAPSNWPGDSDLAREYIARLGALKIVQFVKDVVTDPDLPAYGLNAPERTLAVRFNAVGGITNQVELQFGAEQDGKVFVRRIDEASIYAVGTNEFQLLPIAGWELRERKPWSFSIEDVKRVAVRNEGRLRELLRQGSQSWQLAPGSQGIIHDLAVEETMRGLSGASVDRWVALGAEHREEFGIRDGGFEVLTELKDGRSIRLEFGRMTPSQGAYAAVTLDGLIWIGEFPWILCRDIVAHLSPPSPAPTK